MFCNCIPLQWSGFILAAFAQTVTLLGQDRLPPLVPQDLERMLSEIKPLPGESPWREIAWLTDVTEARRAAMEQGKPLAIFTAADGSPLGRT